MKRGLGLCLVGPGGIAKFHMQALTQLGLCNNLWVVGLTDGTASTFADVWRFDRSTTQLSDALSDDAVDLVLITSPNQLHAKQALLALDAGKHVIVEIPVAMSLAEAEQVAARAIDVGRRVQVCHTMRSFPAIRALREWVRAGTFTLSQISSFTATPRRHNDHWIGGTRDWVDNLLWHNSCHYLDTSLWVLGPTEPYNVCAQFGRRNTQFGMTMDLSVSFATQQSHLVSLASTYNTSHGTSRMIFVGDERLLVLDDGRLVDEHGNELFGTAAWTDLVAQDRAMIRSILEELPSDFEVDTVLPTMRLVDLASQFEPVSSSQESV